MNVLKASNGNILIGGYSWSDSSGDKTRPTYYDTLWSDCWIVYVDTNGNKIWDKTLGGNKGDGCSVMFETNDHAFLIGGGTTSDSSDDITQQPKDSIHAGDFLLFKIDSNGNKIWDKRYGGEGGEIIFSIVGVNDGGYLLGGYSDSNISGDKSDSSRGGEDFWIVKIDSLGNKQWDKTYGGNNDDDLYEIVNTFDGGYLLAGWSFSDSSGEKSQPNWDTSGVTCDYWIVKIDSLGNKQWDKRYGGTDYDDLFGCEQLPDSGFILSGESYSQPSGDKTAPLLGESDYWVIRIDKNGNKVWDKKYGGYDSDQGGLISKTNDGGFLVSGTSGSGIGSDKTQANLGEDDGWIVKIDSGGNKIWDKDLQIVGTEGSGIVMGIENYPNCYYFISNPDGLQGG